MSEYKIELKDITKEFVTKRQTIVAVEHVDFGVREGELIALVGPSGCGKSTIIRMMDGIVEPTYGSIRIGEHTYTKKPPKELLKEMGFIFQNHNLLPWKTVRENLELPLKIMKLKGEKWDKHVNSLLEMVGLTDCQPLYPSQISGGMQQRLGVIRAMVYDPEILLMDEPFGHLDEIMREALDFEILKIWAQTKKTILFITHNITEAVLLASRVFVMGTNPGRIVEEIEVELPYPRNTAMMDSDYFIGLEDKITQLIGHVKLDVIK